MPIDIGPQMLEHLEGKLRRGEITQSAYDAKKVEILELIRTGRAVDMQPLDRVLQAVFILVGLGLGGYFIAVSTNIIGVLLGAACIIAGFVGARRAGRA